MKFSLLPLFTQNFFVEVTNVTSFLLFLRVILYKQIVVCVCVFYILLGTFLFSLNNVN